jgi:hypothetical protein
LALDASGFGHPGQAFAARDRGGGEGSLIGGRAGCRELAAVGLQYRSSQ